MPTGVTEAMSPADWLFPDPWAHSTTSQGTAGPSSGSQGDKGKDTIRVKAMAYLVSHLLSELTQEDCACSTPRHSTTEHIPSLPFFLCVLVHLHTYTSWTYTSLQGKHLHIMVFVRKCHFCGVGCMARPAPAFQTWICFLYGRHHADHSLVIESGLSNQPFEYILFFFCLV